MRFLDKMIGKVRFKPVTPDSVPPTPLDPLAQSTIDTLQFHSDQERRLARLTMAEVQTRLADGALRLVRG